MIDWDNLPARVPMIDGPSLSNQLMETFIDRYRADFYLIRLLGLPNQPCELMRDLMVFLPEGDPPYVVLTWIALDQRYHSLACLINELTDDSILLESPFYGRVDLRPTLIILPQPENE